MPSLKWRRAKECCGIKKGHTRVLESSSRGWCCWSFLLLASHLFSLPISPLPPSSLFCSTVSTEKRKTEGRNRKWASPIHPYRRDRFCTLHVSPGDFPSEFWPSLRGISTWFCVSAMQGDKGGRFLCCNGVCTRKGIVEDQNTVQARHKRLHSNVAAHSLAWPDCCVALLCGRVL